MNKYRLLIPINKKSKARGLYQITEICLKEYNHYNKKEYKSIQLYNPNINYKIAYWYINIRIPQMLRYYKKEITIKNILICYYGGISYLIENKRLTKKIKNYIKKYFQYALAK